MNFYRSWYKITIALLVLQSSLVRAQSIKPVTPNASPEVASLLAYLQSISGKYILPGQHNFPISGERNSQFAADFIGKTPVVWSQDFGFSHDGDKDSYLARPAIIEEAIRQHKRGAIVTLCWHAVPPTANEPVTFQPLPGYDSSKLASVQGRLLDQQFEDLLTPGTKLHKNWLKQVDVIAFHLKKLQDAKVPVLWRPYHEMNGDWFWWGGRFKGKYTTAALYRQMFDRLVNHHNLNNLIWVWSVDRPSKPDREFDKYYPGTEYLDLLSLDVYGKDFKQSYYDDLVALSNGKPLVLGEVGTPPSLEIINKQPKWTFWVVWSGMTRNTSRIDYEKLAADSRVVFMEDAPYCKGTAGYRKACGLQPITVERKADFSGEWMLNEYESKIENVGPSNTPYKLNIDQHGSEMVLESTAIVEWADDETITQTLALDGRDVHSTIFNHYPRIQNANWSQQQDTLTIDSKVTFNWGGRSFDVNTNEVWRLERRGQKLVISQSVKSIRGTRNSTIIYDKR
jgi:mannan endo-1,4-beta-mannosidase